MIEATKECMLQPRIKIKIEIETVVRTEIETDTVHAIEIMIDVVMIENEMIDQQGNVIETIPVEVKAHLGLLNKEICCQL